jgi:hypothetical protein
VYADAKPGEPVLDDTAFYDFVGQSLANGTGYVHFFRPGKTLLPLPNGLPVTRSFWRECLLFGHDIHLPKAFERPGRHGNLSLVYAIVEDIRQACRSSWSADIRSFPFRHHLFDAG